MKNGFSRVFRGTTTVMAAAFVLIAVTVTAGVVYLQSYTADRFKEGTIAATLADETLFLNAATWSELFKHGPEVGQPEPRNLYGDFASQRARVSELASQGPAELRPQIEEFVSTSDRVVALGESGEFFQANDLQDSQTPIVMRIAASLLDISEEKTAAAEQTRQYASVAAVMLVVAALTGVVAMFWRYSSAQGRALRAEADHEVLKRSEARFRPLVQHATDVILVANEDLVATYISPAANRLGEPDPDSRVGTHGFEVIHPDDLPRFTAFVEEVKGRPGYTAIEEFKWQFPSGTFVIETSCTNLLDNPDVRGLVFNMHDITDRKALEEQLRHQAFHDSLTGLANRLLFMERLEHALLRNRIDSKHSAVSVIYLDIDHFKNVNDELGHSIGDQLLKALSDRIHACIRPADTAARLGGDEFAVLLEDTPTREGAHRVADSLLMELSKPILLEGTELTLSASIGVVVADPVTLTVEEVIRNADIAMYDAKAAGRGCVRMFEPHSRSLIMERLHMIHELNEAVKQGEFEVVYQPTVQIDDRSITGFEALVRWHHPTLGLLQPSQFIPLSEETGIVTTIGEFVLRTACQQSVAWREQFPEYGRLTMSVNVSTRQIERGGLVSMVKQVLDETGMDPSLLVLEVTESVLIANAQHAIKVMSELKELGVSLALDDFGTGYSSLSYMKRFPIDILKIDRTFTDGIDRSDRERLIFQNVVDLGNMMQLKIVAEGIERQEQLSRLQSFACDLGQGYLFARPLEPQAVERLLGATDARDDALISNRPNSANGSRAVA